MCYSLVKARSWAELNFQDLKLGDSRLNVRVRDVAAALAAHPAASIPQACGTWRRTKGAYRLFDNDALTLESISTPHWQGTRQEAASCPCVLLIQDTTWIDQRDHPATRGLGHFGRKPGTKNKTSGHGLFLHSTLAVQVLGEGKARILGLAHAATFVRSELKKDRGKRRRAPDRESRRWIDSLDAIGTPDQHQAAARERRVREVFTDPSAMQFTFAENESAFSPIPYTGDGFAATGDGFAATGEPARPRTRWIHVGDRESDLFDLLEKAGEKGLGFIIRLKHDRNVLPGHDTPAVQNSHEHEGTSLKDLCRGMAKIGSRTVSVAAKNGNGRREAVLSVSAGPVTLYSPRTTRNNRAVKCWVVRAWEENPPEGVEPLEWMILSSQEARDEKQALWVLDCYTLRWLIEEYHKCLKSGCKVQERQLESKDRLDPLIGMLSIVAVRLLGMKNDARLSPDTPAMRCVEPELVRTLALLIKDPRPQEMSLRRFIHETARQGGFLGRKADGEPGYQTLWRGYHTLTQIHLGRQLQNPTQKDVGKG